MAATLSVRVHTGTNAGVESAAQTGVVLCAADALTGPAIAPGTYSYERWLRVRVDAAPTNGVSAFWIERTGAVPSGMTIRFGVTDTPATPKQTVSSVATTELTAGRRFIWDMGTYDTTGDHSRYLVLQAQVEAGAASGAIEQNDLEIGWQES